MATEYATLVFKADTKEIGQAYNQLKKLNREGKISDATFKSLTVQTDRLGNSAKGAGRNIGQMSRSAGQAGIQVQQFVGQITAGTNPMVAFSQQAADLGIVLGAPLLGAIGGIGASIAMVLLPALFQGGDAMEEMRESAEKLAESVDDLSESQRAYFALLDQRQQEEYRREIEELEKQIAKLNVSLNEITQSYIAFGQFTDGSTEANEKNNAETLRLQSTIDTLNQKIQDLQGNIDKYTGAVVEETDAQRKAREETEGFIQRIQEQIDTFGKSRSEILLYNASLMNLTPAQQMQVEILADLIDKKEADIQATKDQAQAERELNEAIRAEMGRRAAEQRRIDEVVRNMQAAERDLQAQGLLEAEAGINSSYDRRLAKLQEYKQKELITEQQFNEAKKKLDQQTAQSAINQLGEGLTALGQYNEKAFKAAKAFNIGQAIMNTYTGATKALATYPPPFNFIAAAGVVASGLAQVASIKSQTYQGRALGGQVRSGESYVVGERGPEVLTMGGSGRIIPNDKLGGQQQVVNRTANITFEISTVDARGFDQLLQSRRGQIINMVNSAMNDQGRRGVA